MLARYCYSKRPSVYLSVRLSVALMYRGRMCWVSSKIIIRIISLGLRSSEPQHRQSSPRETPSKFRWNRGGVALLSRKPAIFLKWGKVGPRLLLMTNRKSHMRFRFVSKSTTVNDLEGPLCTLFQNTCVFIAHHENLNEDRPTLSATKM